MGVGCDDWGGGDGGGSGGGGGDGEGSGSGVGVGGVDGWEGEGGMQPYASGRRCKAGEEVVRKWGGAPRRGRGTSAWSGIGSGGRLSS